MSTVLLYVFAFFSGFAALIYQVAWSRMLSLTFGSSTLAVSAVVAGFMGGMGIGAWIYHRVAGRIDSAVRAYALLEISIALSTALLTIIYAGLPDVFAGLASIVPEGATMRVFRVAAAFVLLLVPAAIMGGTYPALCRALLRTSTEVEGRLGWIYGLNTVGAAAGAIVTGMLLIEWVGSTGAVGLANAINLAIGISSLALARSILEDTTGSDSQADDVLSSDIPYWLTALVLFGSGFATLGYEIVWFRALHYLIGPGTYTLSAILTIFLLGLGIGGFLYRPALRFGRPELNLGFGLLGIAFFAILAIGGEHLILADPALSERFGVLRVVTDLSWQKHLTFASLIATALLLPATLCMGVIFPVASRLFLGSMQELTSRVGLAYLLSNLGSIGGAILAALWILPALGTIGGTKVLAALNLALAVFVLWKAASRQALVAGLVSAFAIALVARTLPERLAFWPLGFSKDSRVTLEFAEESDLGAVMVLSMPEDDRRAMAIDGVFVSATENWNPGIYAKQIALAHLPMQLDWSIRTTLNLGLAGGSTLATLARYRQLETLDVVEINPAVVRGGRFFRDFAVLEDSRVDVILEDAVHYLLTTDRKYDLIINDAKQQVRFAGNAKILSREFYQYALESLSECGLFAQAIGITRDAESLRLILRTLLLVFPELEIFLVTPRMSVMLGSRCPVADRARPTAQDLDEAGVGHEIERYFNLDVTHMDALWIGTGDEIRAVIGEGPINDWNSLPLEFIGYRRTRATVGGWRESLEMILGPRLKEGTPESPFVQSASYPLMLKTTRALLNGLGGDAPGATRLLHEVLREEPDHPMARQVQQTFARLLNRPRMVD